jgi:hypothetical protein
LASLRQFNREAFHAAGQRYGNASRGCSVVVSRCILFAPTGDNIDRGGDEQSGNNDHGEYVTHGNPSIFILGIVPITPKFSVTAVTKFLFFVDFHPVVFRGGRRNHLQRSLLATRL